MSAQDRAAHRETDPARQREPTHESPPTPRTSEARDTTGGHPLAGPLRVIRLTPRAGMLDERDLERGKTQRIIREARQWS
jgi:hypothetical protein